MSDIASVEDYRAKKKSYDERWPVAKNPANVAVERAAERAQRRRRRQKRLETRQVVNPCVTRGESYTDFPKNRLGKHLLDRCGRAAKKLDISNEATFDEILDYGVGVA
jgi:hypothetical protein